MESLGPVWIVDCQLLYQFYIDFWNLLFNFVIRHMILVSFGPCAPLPFLLVWGLVTSLWQPNMGGVLLFTFTNLRSWWMQNKGLSLWSLPFLTLNITTIRDHFRNHFCPVQIILDYLSLRGQLPGALFSFVDGSPVSRALFIDRLSMAIKYCGLDPSRYKGHSFRIGAASFAADAGMSDAQIRALGRWKSNAFQKYIRIPSLSS